MVIIDLKKLKIKKFGIAVILIKSTLFNYAFSENV